MKLKTSKNGKLIHGDSTQAVGHTVSHYAGSR
jgi:hypothetical protein